MQQQPACAVRLAILAYYCVFLASDVLLPVVDSQPAATGKVSPPRHRRQPFFSHRQPLTPTNARMISTKAVVVLNGSVQGTIHLQQEVRMSRAGLRCPASFATRAPLLLLLSPCVHVCEARVSDSQYPAVCVLPLPAEPFSTGPRDWRGDRPEGRSARFPHPRVR